MIDTGTQDQLPDPKIEAVQGIGAVPAYRGTAYVVIEDLQLEAFGNRVPQFSFEVIQGAPDDAETLDIARQIEAVALIPGTGEYALATTPVYMKAANNTQRAVNINTPLGVTDFEASREALFSDLPNHKATSLVISWFGTDLRAGTCQIAPRVDQKSGEGSKMAWAVSGLKRSTASLVPYLDDRPVYGGTPTDQSVIEAISVLREGGREVMFYPFVLMEQLAENGLEDPWTGAPDQPALPWRGRITLSVAPGRDGSPDGTQGAADEVAAFFGAAAPGDFPKFLSKRNYSGPPEFSYRRFILHYAYLCADAGGVDAFCIGSELRGLTQIRGPGGSFPVVDALRALAADVRSILGPDTKIGYAADWSEYFGYHPQDGSGDVLFQLDPLWADPEIDFVGIDNYMPLSDWRDGEDHADAGFGSIYNLEYLRGNVAGGEGYDWYYAGPEGKAAQKRLAIVDTAHGEDWVFRYKDLVNWWASVHYDRPGGVRSSTPTAWQPGAKPIWLTELGCPAVDKGTNAPNVFYDPKSSESALPPYSSGRRDDFIQRQALTAIYGHWSEPENNPVSPIYGGPMVDLSHAFVWAWDARPFPFFPNQSVVWSDGANYQRGHWLNGRMSARGLADVVREICAWGGLTEIDVSGVYGVVRGFSVEAGTTPRAALQALMLAHGVDATDRNGVIHFTMRGGRVTSSVAPGHLATTDDLANGIERIRAPEAELVGRVRVSSIESEGDYQIRAVDAVFPDDTADTISETDLPMLLTAGEGRAIAERWLAEARVARDTVQFALPPSRMDIGAGDVVTLPGTETESRYRIDRLEHTHLLVAEAQRVEAGVYVPSPDVPEDQVRQADFAVPVPVDPVFLDLPLLTGGEVAHAPHLAVASKPWSGPAAVYKSPAQDGFELASLVQSPAVMGETETDLVSAAAGLWDRGAALRVRMWQGGLTSVTEEALLNGANAAAIGSGSDDLWEVFQFAEATLVAPDVYDLRLRLRGQVGTDAVMPGVWPAGSRFVLLTSALVQPDLGLSERQLARTWRIGPSRKPADDPVYAEEVRAFDGVGLRPYAPVHLRARSGTDGYDLSWIRRTRIDGDSWAGMDVPLNEESEVYIVRGSVSGAVIREVTVETPSWTYSTADWTADGARSPFTVDIAQVSTRFGPGPFRSLTIHD